MRPLNIPDFRLLTTLFLPKYKIDKIERKPLLRVSKEGDIYFIHEGNKRVIDRSLRDVFLQNTRGVYDYHYDV